MNQVASQAYLHDAIRRLDSGEVEAASHAAGVFGRCATGFEGEIRLWLMASLRRCGLDYNRDIRAHCKGVMLDKTTLGNLIAGIGQAALLKPECVGSCLSGDIPSVMDDLKRINDVWRRMKHREEIPTPVMLECMKAMSGVTRVLSGRATPT